MNTLQETNYVIYNKSKDQVKLSIFGVILILDDEDTLVSCLDLPQHWQDRILKQLNQGKSK